MAMDGRSRPARARRIGLAAGLAALLLAWAVGELTPSSTEAPSSAEARATDDAARVVRAFEEGRSGLRVELAGRVERTLPDDEEGARHQRFVLELANGHTVLVAHNLDLAPRVPLERGARVRLRGEYEWNRKGGVVHWTHHDPDGRHEGGWIEADGRRYE